MLAAACAVGVACTFAAPIGGKGKSLSKNKISYVWWSPLMSPVVYCILA